MSAIETNEPAQHPRHLVRRMMLAAWQLASGYLLAAAPLSRVIWGEGFYAWLPGLRSVLTWPPVQYGISGVGLCLLLMGCWDTAGILSGNARE